MEMSYRFFICVHSPPDHLKILSHCLTGRYSILSFLLQVFISCWGVALKCGSLSLPVTSEHAHILWPPHLHLYLHVITLLNGSSIVCWDSLVAQTVKNLPAMQEFACQAGNMGSICRSGRSPGKGNGNLLQYSCPKTSVNRRAWRATVHRDSPQSKSWTWLSN